MKISCHEHFISKMCIKFTSAVLRKNCFSKVVRFEMVLRNRIKINLKL